LGNSVLPVGMSNCRIAGWAIFAIAAVLTWVIYAKAWMIGPYYLALSLLALLNLAVGIWVTSLYRFAWRATLIVVVILLVGQWWFVEAAIVQGLWTMRGFAP